MLDTNYYATGGNLVAYILTGILLLISGGGLVAIINVLANRNKNKSEVTNINVQTAMELERVAMTRYTELRQTLYNVEILLDGFRLELDSYRTYVVTLQHLLQKYGIEYPEMSKDTKPAEAI